MNAKASGESKSECTGTPFRGPQKPDSIPGCPNASSHTGTVIWGSKKQFQILALLPDWETALGLSESSLSHLLKPLSHSDALTGRECLWSFSAVFHSRGLEFPESCWIICGPNQSQHTLIEPQPRQTWVTSLGSTTVTDVHQNNRNLPSEGDRNRDYSSTATSVGNQKSWGNLSSFSLCSLPLEVGPLNAAKGV